MSRKTRTAVRLYTQAQACRALIDLFEGKYGGEGWQDPRVRSPQMAEIVKTWMEWPVAEHKVDSGYICRQADLLEEQGFDPRHFVHMIREKSS